MSDINQAAGRELADQTGTTLFENGEELIHADDVDAVLVASSDQTHEQYVLAALECQKFVLCEKPLAPDSEGCRRIIDKEMAGGKQRVQVGFMRRYDSGYRALKDMLSRREYGEPLIVHCSHRNVTIPGFTTSMLVTNCATHEIDVLRWLLDEEYVSCEVVFPKKTRRSADDLHDPQIILLQTQSGVWIDVEIFANCQYGYDINCEVVCEDGTISLPTPTGVLVRSKGRRSLPITDHWEGRFSHAYEVELQEWINAVKKGVVAGPSAWDRYVTSIITAACVKARDSGTRVDIHVKDCPPFYQQ